MKEISKALLKAQGEFLPIEKKTEAFKYKYAPLDNVLDCIRPALSKYGILITQPCEIEDGTPVQKTVLFHTDSGESIVSTMELQCTSGAQDRGSEVTYLRRYTLINAAGVFPVDEDDDGKLAQDSSRKPLSTKSGKFSDKKTSTKSGEPSSDQGRARAAKKATEKKPTVKPTEATQEGAQSGGPVEGNGVAEAYRVFLQDCNTIEELRDFWKKNQEELKKLEKSHAEIYKSVFDLFATKKKALNKKEAS
tara:strand:- start:7846 stop:8592 length:747 start_codon:yes stop_codon:yes gene_type:complete